MAEYKVGLEIGAVGYELSHCHLDIAMHKPRVCPSAFFSL